MKTLILTLTLALGVVAGAQAQYYGGIDAWFYANPDLVGGSSYAGRVVNPNYMLVD